MMPMLSCLSAGAETNPLSGTAPLTREGDLAAQMVAGIDAWLMRALEESLAGRKAFWQRDFASGERYSASAAPNRERLRRMLGAQDAREAPEMRFETPAGGAETAPGRGAGYTIHAVRWNALRNVEGEGLLLLPDRPPVADIIALPDCDATPEQLAGLAPGTPKAAQFARRLAESGCRALIPFLLDRGDAYSGVPGVRMTNLPHREFVYRAAYEMGRHIFGFEIQKVLAAADWFRQDSRGKQPRPLGIIGHGEGGRIALFAAALDTRFDAAAVCGAFEPREALWREPIYRNVFGLLREFGDAEIASLIAPRALIVEASRHPKVSGPPPKTPERSGAAPGTLATPPMQAAQAEFDRARALTERLSPPVPLMLTQGTFPRGRIEPGRGLPGSEETLTALLRALGVRRRLAPSGAAPSRLRHGFDPEARRRRQFAQLMEHTQWLMRESEFRRAAFWAKADAGSVETWQQSAPPYRDIFWNEIIGKLPASPLPLNPHSRLVTDTPKFRGYEVTLDVYPDVFAYGILLIPKDMRPGEQRAVVVCQHGLEGRPQDVADPDVDNPAYHRFACRLAEEGFITFSPQNPYIGEDRFRALLRKAQPLGLTLFSFITRQHERILDWLQTLPFADPQRIAFYGLSYGGKTAMRVPALLERYCLSICSADYNEWVWKNASARSPYSYLLTPEYDMPEWNLANAFNYAEMSWLICPRPFMVERGHHDGVAPDEWVAYEFARTRRRYALLGLGDRAEIEFFDGPHTIHGVGTLAFLKRHLARPGENAAHTSLQEQTE